MWFNTRIRSTPYTERVEALGVKAYSVYNHMLLPLAFRTVAEDYHHLKQHVQLWDVAAQRQVEVYGADAATLVQLMTPRDISKAAPGRCLYTPLVDSAGGIVNDPVVLKLDEDRFWISIGDSDVALWADGLAVGMGLDVEIFEPDVSPLAVQGPKAEELVVRVFGEAVREITFFRFASLDFGGHPLRVARTGWSKQGGFEIYLDDESLGGELWDALWEAGEDLDVGPGAPNLIERIEGGLLSYGGDMTREHDPFECGFDAFVHLDRPIEFLAREALERIAARGLRRRIKGLRIDGELLPSCRRPWPVLDGDDVVGYVSSAATSPDLGCGIAIAMMHATHWHDGTRVEVDTGDDRFPAEVDSLPFGKGPSTASHSAGRIPTS
ncbi:MAG: dimethylsulfoniopropionate demethylase [Ilumatobacter sp.]|nr:dimethylsulfoniopropionate demethylase [Ilumatobacter sp.]